MSRRKKSDYFGYVSRRQMKLVMEIATRNAAMLQKWLGRKSYDFTSVLKEKSSLHSPEYRLYMTINTLKWATEYLKLMRDFTQERKPSPSQRDIAHRCEKCRRPATYTCSGCFSRYCSDCAKEQEYYCHLCAPKIVFCKNNPHPRSYGKFPSFPYIISQTAIFIDILEKDVTTLKCLNKQKLLECSNTAHKYGHVPNVFCYECQISFLPSQLEWLLEFLKIEREKELEEERLLRKKPLPKKTSPPSCTKCGEPARHECILCQTRYCKECKEKQESLCHTCARKLERKKK